MRCRAQELALLLRRLKPGGHRALIFTQMAKMLDVLEVFLNLHGFTYVRLDGSTKPEQRQVLMQRFNTDTKVRELPYRRGLKGEGGGMRERTPEAAPAAHATDACQPSRLYATLLLYTCKPLCNMFAVPTRCAVCISCCRINPHHPGLP